MKFTGIVVALGTPLTRDEDVDEPGLRRLVRHVLDAGAHGVLVNGSMGGFAFLTDAQQLRALSLVVSEVAGAVPVLAGLGETGTRRAIEKARCILQTRPDFLTALPPFFFRANQRQLVSYFSAIAAVSDVPVFLYNNPIHTKCHIHPNTVIELHETCPTIVGIKDSDSDCGNLRQLLLAMKRYEGFSILTGSETLLLSMLQMGCDGSIGGLHNICPELVVDLYEAFRAGDLCRAREDQQRIIELSAIFHQGAVWGGFDEALRYLGICECASAAPYSTAMNEEEKREVRRILDQHLAPYLAARPTRLS